MKSGLRVASTLAAFCRFFPAPLLIVLLTLVATATSPGQLVPPETEDGRTQLFYRDEPFQNYSAAENSVSFVKFSILLNDPGTAYFQHSENFPFHYDFAREHLQPFLGMPRTQFDAVALRREGQQVALGAVLFAPYDGPREVGIQFVGLDPYPKETIAQWFNVVKNAIVTTDGGAAPKAIYMPTYEQRAAAESERAWFESQGIEVGGPERWLAGDQLYSPGWALGRLVQVPGDEIGAAYADGRLKYNDILLTDGVPAEVPFLAGILSLSAATPNSHVAILARNQGVPFAYVSAPEKQEKLLSLVGKEVLLRGRDLGFGRDVLISAVDEDLDPRLRAQILAYKKPQKAKIAPIAKFGAISSDVTNLTPRSVKHFGGKASNYGLLRRTIPNDSLPAMALSFDLWTAYLGNVNPETGLTLREEIHQRLSGFAWPPNIAEARVRLEEIRRLIDKKVKFTDGQKEAIVKALLAAGFDPNRQLRFRSSTNVEDTGVLTGAGLYESSSGCLADSLDGDQDGPSHCCQDDPEEDTVLSALENVFASLYNENAWLERLRHGVREEQAGMAVLVHHNFPDEDELANGVATLTWERQPVGGPELAAARPKYRDVYSAKIVTQLGANSVTNPEGGVKPEVVIAAQDGADPSLSTDQYSSLVPLGAHVMPWEDDYRELFRLLQTVAEGYARMFPEKQGFTLDFEFKRHRVAPEQAKLIIKQVRELVEPKSVTAVPFLLNDPAEYVVLQTESGDAFAYHRLKSALNLQTRNLRLSPAQVRAGLHEKSSLEFLAGKDLQHLANGPRTWPGHRFSFNGGAATDRWKFGTGKATVNYKLRTALTVRADAAEDLVFTQRDFKHTLTAIYKKPLPYIDFEGIKIRQSDSAEMVPRDTLPPQEEPQIRNLNHPSGVSVETRFFWPKVTNDFLIKTYPLAAWGETRITGLTAVPLVLTDNYAQTYAPGHHNFQESFLFEPRLDPGVSEEQIAELAARNVQAIHIRHDRDGGVDSWHVLGTDGNLRPEP